MNCNKDLSFVAVLHTEISNHEASTVLKKEKKKRKIHHGYCPDEIIQKKLTGLSLQSCQISLSTHIRRVESQGRFLLIENGDQLKLQAKKHLGESVACSELSAQRRYALLSSHTWEQQAPSWVYLVYYLRSHI